jgi:arginyl-tRNA--protein-N-Asp/Glu arginylyltransferase
MFCEERYSTFATWFGFLVNKKQKKKYKAKFSTNLILKKKPTKIILEGKKPMRKDVAVIDNVLW